MISTLPEAASGDLLYREFDDRDHPDRNAPEGAPHYRLIAALNLFLSRFAVFLALPNRVQALFLPLGAFGGALHQFRANQLEHGLLGAVALPVSQADNASVAAGRAGRSACPTCRTISSELREFLKAQRLGDVCAMYRAWRA